MEMSLQLNTDIIKINSVDFSGSVCDGPGIRTVLFLQGCNVRCEGCHNPETWDINAGKSIQIKNLVEQICTNSLTKRITITGGEPMMQSEALSKLISYLFNTGYDIALYTSYMFDEIPQSIIDNLNYIKCGKFLKKYQTTTLPYVGSTNQKFIVLKKGDNIYE